MAGRENVTLQLVAIAGPPRPAITLRQGEAMTLGRSGACQVVLDDTERRVSRQHATITFDDGRWRITDDNSRFGTRVNDQPVERGGRRKIGPGDRIQIGPWTFLVSRTEGAAEVTSTVATVDRPEDAERIARISPERRETLAQHRLRLLLDVASRLPLMATQRALVDAVLLAAREGTGFPRAALLRPVRSLEEVELAGVQSSRGSQDDSFEFSRSLIRAASSGEVAALAGGSAIAPAESIVRLNIREAVCAPIIIDQHVEWYLYLDARGGAERAHEDAAEYAGAIAHLAGLAFANVRRRSVERDVAVARDVQVHLTPPATGRAAGVRYAVQSIPGRGVAGDLFDIVAIDDHRAAICIGDVSGEGVGSGVMMAVVIAYLHAALQHTANPAAAIGSVNAYLASRSPGNMFVSLWVGIIDSQARRLSFVDAGHAHWLLRRRDGVDKDFKVETHLLVGIEPEYPYEPTELDFEPGDRLILFTDGLTEQPPAGVKRGEDEFGRDRLIEIINHSDSIEHDVQAILDAVREFAGTDMLSDDATVASIALSTVM